MKALFATRQVCPVRGRHAFAAPTLYWPAIRTARSIVACRRVACPGWLESRMAPACAAQVLFLPRSCERRAKRVRYMTTPHDVRRQARGLPGPLWWPSRYESYRSRGLCSGVAELLFARGLLTDTRSLDRRGLRPPGRLDFNSQPTRQP